jgi:hypothetical protein
MLSLDFTNSTAGVLGPSFDSSASMGLLSNGDSITIYSGPAIAGTVGGLTLDSAVDLKVEYLGKEAGFTNIFHYNADLFTTGVTAPGTSVTIAGAAAGILPFFFQTSGGGVPGSAENGGPIAANLQIAFAALGDGSFIALYDDGGAGTDFDDMAVRISVVPLPAAAWLLISALLGLVSFSRIRRKEAQAA